MNIRELSVSPQRVARLFNVASHELSKRFGSTEPRDELATLSARTTAACLERAIRVPRPRTVGEAGQLAIEALASGLTAGGLDGLIGLTAGQTTRLAAAAAAEKLRNQQSAHGDDLGKLAAQIDKTQAVARDSWSTMSDDDLQLLAGYGKHQNLQTGSEAAPFAEAGQSAEAFQQFLLATFKAGYALGVIDAVIVARGQQPDPVMP